MVKVVRQRRSDWQQQKAERRGERGGGKHRRAQRLDLERLHAFEVFSGRLCARLALRVALCCRDCVIQRER
jgi:hypothetical protein